MLHICNLCIYYACRSSSDEDTLSDEGGPANLSWEQYANSYRKNLVRPIPRKRRMVPRAEVPDDDDDDSGSVTPGGSDIDDDWSDSETEKESEGEGKRLMSLILFHSATSSCRFEDCIKLTLCVV